MIKIQSNLNVAKDLARKNTYYEKDGKIEIIYKQPDGTHLLLRNKQKLFDLKEYEDVNEEVFGKLELLEEKAAFLIEQADFKLEYGQLKFFGDDISYELASSYLSTFGTVMIMLAQEVWNQISSNDS